VDINTSRVPSGQGSSQFIQGMLDRITFGFIKYGSVKSNAGKVDFIESMRLRVKKYKETSNTEFLIDAANFLMFEFMYPSEPGAFFQGTEAKDSPGLVSVFGERIKHPDQVQA
jgi:hypothetical protein